MELVPLLGCERVQRVRFYAKVVLTQIIAQFGSSAHGRRGRAYTAEPRRRPTGNQG